jgi:hypothetical protein
MEVLEMSTRIEEPPSQQKYKANKNTSKRKLQLKEKTEANNQQKSGKDLMQRGLMVVK